MITLAIAAALANASVALSAPAVPVRAGSSLVAVCVNGNSWADGGFEATAPATLSNPNYPVVFSTHFPTGHPLGASTPLCNVGNSDCMDGTTGMTTPRNGSSWAWFGGNDINDGTAEIAYAEQTITFPPPGSSATLNFYLRIGFVTDPFTDTLEVQVDGVTLPGGTFTEPATAESSYSLRTFDLTAFADGLPHAIRFSYTQALPADDNKANFDVDDATLDIVCPGASPTALAVDSIGDKLLEPNETVIVQPTWNNTGGGPLPLTGTSSNFTGPAGPTYDNPDTGGDYGTIAAGTSAECASDCYSVHITAVSRPATHWDASIDETVSTGTAKTWKLHVGDSFTDVAHNGYYPFIETILHNHVTGGCGDGTIFCPGDPTLRYQMVVFVLEAKEGPTYLPPACTPPGTFSDVACPGGVVVDWIEEAYKRGIVAGYPDGTFQPYVSISRAQMAVFLLAAAGITPPACTPPGVFEDVPCPGGFAVNFIEKLYNDGITGGCSSSPKLYCPDPSVSVPPESGLATRAQMAVFLTAAFHLVLYGP